MPRDFNRLGKSNVAAVLEALDNLYPEAKCELNHNTPLQLLVATVLSAQTTDKKVNEVTAELFEKYPTAQDFLTLSQDQLEKHIKTIGLYRNKAKNVLALCQILVENYQGQVPKVMEDLIKLPGVGRKTANVVLSNAFGVPAIAVDTHVFRVSNRIGLVNAENVRETEIQLQERIPKKLWSKAHHLLIWHGRRTCMARNPQCHICPIQVKCLFYKKANEGIKKVR